MDYKELNDYELIYQVREKNELAYGLLIEKYSHLVDMLAKKYLKENKYVGLEYDDLFQEGMVGVMKALQDYNPDDTLFYTYASLCAKREMDRIIKTNSRMKQMALNEAVSFSKKLKCDSDLLLEDMVASNYNLEEDYENKELLNKILDAKNDFSFLDSQIIELKLNGFTTDEIANLMDLKYRTVNYRLKMIRKRLVKYSN